MVLRLPYSWSNWNLELLVFEERGKLEYPEKNLSEQGREPTTNSTHLCVDARIWTRATLVGGERSALTTAPSLAPQRYLYEGRKPETISFCDCDMRWIQLWKFVSLLVDTNAEREVCKLSYADWRLYVRIQVQNKYKGNTSDHLPSPSPYLFLLPPSSVDILEKNESKWERSAAPTVIHLVM